MYLTYEILKQHPMQEEDFEWFEEAFPDGAELVDIFKHPKLQLDEMHWLFNNLATSQVEKGVYLQQAKIACEKAWSVYLSTNVSNSEFVTGSNNVNNSSFIFLSKDVEDSNNILNSETVERSSKVYKSAFVFDSQEVLDSQNITNSRNIVQSDYILESDNVYNSKAVSNSRFVSSLIPMGSNDVNFSQFIFECKNVNYCLFCSQIDGVEYYLFNKPISPVHYNNIIKQLNKMLKNIDMELVDEWSENQIPLMAPNINRNIIKQYSNFPAKFWQWVKTLPGYDSDILYSITYQPDII